MDDDALPATHPAFTAHFTDPLYDDVSGELAPFGTDEGWDLLHEWDERRGELGPTATVADIVEESGFSEIVAELDHAEGPGVPTPAGKVDAATIQIGAGFTLLRLTGRIDDEGRRRTLDALDVLLRRWGAPAELVRQREDLQSWRS